MERGGGWGLRRMPRRSPRCPPRGIFANTSQIREKMPRAGENSSGGARRGRETPAGTRNASGDAKRPRGREPQWFTAPRAWVRATPAQDWLLALALHALIPAALGALAQGLTCGIA
ncbi:hypothetical protein GCM10009805_17920 [Leucobacter chromiireducens subsp. solipictus]